jgi:hypothetical protein
MHQGNGQPGVRWMLVGPMFGCLVGVAVGIWIGRRVAADASRERGVGDRQVSGLAGPCVFDEMRGEFVDAQA